MAYKFTEHEEKAKRFIEAVRLGASIKGCCGLAGIADTTYYDAMRRGKDDEEAGRDTPDSRFYRAIKEAEGAFEEDNLRVIRKAAANKTWAAAAWLLERRRPKEYGPKQDVQVGAESLVIKMDVPGRGCK